MADNLKDAQELIRWYLENIDSKKVTWSVAENFRYLKSLEYAREQVHRAGKLLQFSVKGHGLVQQKGKYIGKPDYVHGIYFVTDPFKRQNGAKSLSIKEVSCWMVGSIE